MNAFNALKGHGFSRVARNPNFAALAAEVTLADRIS
jgi:hypothetical protein